MSQEIAVPDYVKAMMASTGVGVDENLIDQHGVARISTKGKIFRLREGDEETKIKGDLDVIIVGLMPSAGHMKTYYKGKYNKDSNDAPDCSSSNGVTPDNWIEDKQSEVCIKCPQNQWGSAESMKGGKAKACKESKHLYVVLAEGFSEDSKVYMLNITINSQKNLTAFGKKLLKSGLPSCAVITRLSFDEDVEVPCIVLDILGAVNEEVAKVSFKIAADKEWDTPVPVALPARNDQRSLPADIPEDDVSDTDTEFDDSASLVNKW